MKRRQLLVTSGAAVAIAGCLGEDTPTESERGPDADTDGDPGTARQRTTNTPDGTPTAEPTVDAEVSDVSVQSGAVVTPYPDAIGIDDDDGQYLLLDLTVTDGQAPDRTAFSLTTGESDYGPMESRPGLYRDGTWSAGYSPDDGSGTLAFGLPETVPAEETQLRWSGGEWTPSDPVRHRLATETPAFDVTFEVPETVETGEIPSLSVTVTNESEVAGRCVLAMNRVGPKIAYAPVRDVILDVDAGETVSRTWEGKAPTEEDAVTYKLHVANGERRSETIEPADDSG